MRGNFLSLSAAGPSLSLLGRAGEPACVLGGAESAAPLLAFAGGAESAAPLLAFADQADTLAGPLFQASLLPYLCFLYFICYDGNRLAPTAKAGFVSLLAFVTATVVSSIIAVKSYGTTLANVDWLHASVSD